ncbi:MAG: glycosyl hydrolase, partial [Planctomycetota bacterium]|nr:glycosyl hydrolase [Planctomycetota bacterium]
MIGDCVPRRTLLITLLAWSLAGFASGPPSPGYAAAGASQETALDEAFRSPPDEAKPWAYWWWLKGNVSEASIRRDLEAMKRMGFAGLLMFDARGYHEDHVPPPESRMDFMGPEWRRMLKFAISEADRLGLQISVNLSSCAGALKGPWLVGDDAPKQLLWTSLETRGGRTLRCRLPQPEAARSWGVALVAVRHAESNAAAAEEPATEKNASWAGGRQSKKSRTQSGWRPKWSICPARS